MADTSLGSAFLTLGTKGFGDIASAIGRVHTLLSGSFESVANFQPLARMTAGFKALEATVERIKFSTQVQAGVAALGSAVGTVLARTQTLGNAVSSLGARYAWLPSVQTALARVGVAAAYLAPAFQLAGGVGQVAFATLGLTATGAASAIGTVGRTTLAVALPPLRMLGSVAVSGLRLAATTAGLVVDGLVAIGRGALSTAGTIAGSIGGLAVRAFDSLRSAVREAMAHLQQLGTQARYALGAGVAAVGGFVKSFETASDVSRKLSMALTASGVSAEKLMPRFDALASKIHDVTTLSRAQVLGMISLATQLGVAPEKMEGSIGAAIGLMTKYDMSMEQALRTVHRVSMEEMGRLRMLIPELTRTKNAHEQIAIVSRMAAQGFQLAQMQTSLFSGQLAIIRRTATEAGQSIGAMFAPVLEPLVQKLSSAVQDLSKWLGSLSATTKTNIVQWSMLGAGILGVVAVAPIVTGWIGTIGTALSFLALNPIGMVITALGLLAAWFIKTHAHGKTLGEQLASIWQAAVGSWNRFLAFTQVFWTNLGEFAKLGVLESATALVNLWDVMKWLWNNFTGFLGWFGRNWRQVFTDAYNSTTAVFKNLGTNIGEFFVAIAQWFKDPTKGFNFRWTPLLEGFRSTLEEMPKLIDIHFQKPWQANIEAIKKGLGGKLAQAMAEADAKTAAYFAKDKDHKANAAKPEAGKPGITLPGIEDEGGRKRGRGGAGSDLLGILAGIQGGALGGADPKLAEARRQTHHLSMVEKIADLQYKSNLKVLEHFQKVNKAKERQSKFALASPFHFGIAGP